MNKSDTRHPIERLTPEQFAALQLAAHHMSSKEIARELDIAPTTVDGRLQRACVNLSVETRTQAARLMLDYESQNGAPDQTMHGFSPLPTPDSAAQDAPSANEWSPSADNGRTSLREAQSAYDYRIPAQQGSPSLLALLDGSDGNSLTFGQMATRVAIWAIALILVIVFVMVTTWMLSSW